MALSFTLQTSGVQASSSSGVATTFAGSAGDAFLALVNCENGTGTVNSPTMTQTSATWSAVTSIAVGTSGTRARIAAFINLTAAGFSTSVATIDYGGQSQNQITWHILKIAGHYAAGVDTDIIRQSQTSTNGNAGSSALTVLGMGAYSNAGNQCVATIYSDVFQAITGMASFVSIANSTGGNNLRHESYTTTSQETQAPCTFGSSTKATGILLEIRAAADSASGPAWANKITRASKSQSCLAGI